MRCACTTWQDDHAAWLLIPLLGLMLVVGMGSAIGIGLTPGDQWAARHNPDHPVRPTNWGTVIGMVIALLLGGTVLMGVIAFGGQKYFEFQALGAH